MKGQKKNLILIHMLISKILNANLKRCRAFQNIDIRNAGYHFKALLGISKVDRSICTYFSKCQTLGKEIYCFQRFYESPTTRGAGGLDFSAIGGRKQRHSSALIGARVTV
jgi:hypothetical protein